MIKSDLIQLLACPQCHQPVEFAESCSAIICRSCMLEYPIKDDIPVMLREESTPVQHSSLQD